LNVGCGGDEFTQFVNFLGFEATGIDALPLPAASKLPEQEFELVLVRDLAEHRSDLSARQALAVTAELASCVRPGGRLVLLARLDPTWSDSPGGHLRSCFARHLACFPGKSQICYFPDGIIDPRTWNWMLGRQPRSGFLAATLHVEEAAMPRARWRALAAAAARQSLRACCLWAHDHAEQESPGTTAKAA
jgi:SAM-dependent methyltransferase